MRRFGLVLAGAALVIAGCSSSTTGATATNGSAPAGSTNMAGSTSQAANPTTAPVSGGSHQFAATLTVSGAINFFYGEVTSFAVTEAGSISYGPKSTEVCPVNLTIAASFVGNAEHTTKSCTLTGTACGQTINQSCM